MIYLEDKWEFIETTFFEQLATIPPDTKPLWGKMNLHQMVEHLSEYVQIASGRVREFIVVSEEQMEKNLAFLESEKPFKENTPNSLMPTTPREPYFATLDLAIQDLKDELAYFFWAYDVTPYLAIDNPFFGPLDIEQQIQLLYKHFKHHLRQFGIN
ncbi:MAG: hypothetical protein EBX41_05580 [Chitinophagia bacterium]|nr:hypothetical protein [Chitinophagia bacterium]